ncbi:MAG TPA: FKBP-type peptidyl-prolyl cis-trans isomerase [Pyrinomonadaceae bacterium]|nr:FKBP-type peptidyl-prolyl cis-trans isomerase [Pyrinomonadaceae bacterium]
MPQSRHRKIVRAKKRPKTYTPGNVAVSTNSSPAAKKDQLIKMVALVLGVALLAGLGYWLLVRNRENVITTASGLKYVEVVEGTGASPQPGQTVSVHYRGTLENGKQFDSSYDRGQPTDFKFGVGQVIKGWDEALKTMKVGGKRKLIIPSKIGYGVQGRPPDIPPNATLLFDIELMGIK